MTKAEHERARAWRFKVLQRACEGSQNVARTCRHFGISRQAFYRWKRRYAAHGDAGLWDRPRTPHRSPRATPREVVGKILYLRQHYHFGPGRIADYLKRFHQRSLAVSSVHRILVRHGMNRLPANQKHQPQAKRWQRYEKAQPGHRYAAIPIHRHRRLHADSRAEGVRRVQPGHGHPFYRPRLHAPPVSSAGGADRQRCRVSVEIPLASGDA